MEKEMKIIHRNQKFPLRISEKLERKIRVLCNKFPTTEWSGQLFYTYTGSFEKGDIVFVAEDLLFMDTGGSVTTEFYLDEANAAAYIADHELWNCQLGLIHSHHSMQAFFSGQDDSMLLQEGKARNHFLSLVVNNEGKYVARITTKETCDYLIKATRKFNTFNDVPVELSVEDETQTIVSVSTYDLEIQNDFSYACDDYEELMETIKKCDEIKKQRLEREKKEEEKKKKNKSFSPYFPESAVENERRFPSQQEIQFPYQPDKDSQAFNSRRHALEMEEENFEETGKVRGNYQENEIPDNILTGSEISYYAAQIISLGFLHTNTKGIAKFVNNMDKLMSARFGTMENYAEALEFLCDYLFDTELWGQVLASDKVPEEYAEEAYLNAKLQIADYFAELLKINPENKYLQVIYDHINQ